MRDRHSSTEISTQVGYQGCRKFVIDGKNNQIEVTDAMTQPQLYR